MYATDTNVVVLRLAMDRQARCYFICAKDKKEWGGAAAPRSHSGGAGLRGCDTAYTLISVYTDTI